MAQQGPVRATVLGLTNAAKGAGSASPLYPVACARKLWSALPANGSGAVAVLLALTFLITHLALLPPTPTGVDAVNFALGVREFNVADHRPHPPGYPVFIALGKASRGVLARLPLAPASEFGRLEARALAMWSVVFGAITVFAFQYLFRAIEPNDRRAVAAAALTVTCPLFWFTAMRPMSDISGLAAAAAAQALTVTAFRRGRQAVANARLLLIIGAFVSGLAIGFRSQAIWLTLPVLVFATIDQAQRRRDRTPLYTAAAVCLGVLLWGVPLMLASGGPAGYVAALAVQVGEDVSGVRMLATAPDVREAMHALVRLIAYPWANKYLVLLIASLATVGGIRLMLSARPACSLLALCFAPYAIFHLLFQDTTHIRYALPVVPPLAYLSVRGLDTIAPRMMVGVAAALAVAGVAVATPPVVRYIRVGSPSFRAIEAVREELPRTDRRPVLAMHHAVLRVLRLEGLPATTLQAPAKREWLELVKYWRAGGDAPIWFLAEPERTDLALIDPTARRLRRSYRLPLDRRFFMSGVRPSGVDWYEIDSPGWFVAEGWAITHETAGVASADGRGPDRAPITAYVKRRTEAAVALVGGRHLDPGGKTARFELSIDGRLVDSWVVNPKPGFFLHMMQLPPGALAEARQLNPTASDAAADSGGRAPQLSPGGHYALMQIHSVPSDGSGTRVPTSVDQFNVQSADRVVFGFGEGWYEQEYGSATDRPWRWAGPTAAVRIHHGGRDLRLRVRGLAPVRLLGGNANITIRAGDVVLRRVTVSEEFTVRVRVPAALLTRSGGVLTIESDRTFVPDAVLRNGDRRSLALQVSDLRVDTEPDRRVSPRRQ